MVLESILTTTIDTGALPGLGKNFCWLFMSRGHSPLPPICLKNVFSKRCHIIYRWKSFLCSLRIAIELGSKTQYFGVNDVNYVKKIIFPNHYILCTIEKHFLCSLRITIELGSKNQYFGINDLSKSREFDNEAYSDRMNK